MVVASDPEKGGAMNLPKWIQRAHPASNERYSCQPMCQACKQFEALVIAWPWLVLFAKMSTGAKEALRRISELGK